MRPGPVVKVKVKVNRKGVYVKPILTLRDVTVIMASRPQRQFLHIYSVISRHGVITQNPLSGGRINVVPRPSVCLSVWLSRVCP